MFASDATSTEPLRSAANALGGARNTNSFEAAEPALWECARFVQARGKRAVFWSVPDPTNPQRKALWADMNRVFRGSAAFIELAVPPEMMIDERHFSASGSAAVARALHEVTASAFATPR